MTGSVTATIRLFVIYYNPSDYPGKFVMREQAVVRGEILKARVPMIVCDTIATAREMLPWSVFPLGREPNDDPVIQEVWML